MADEFAQVWRIYIAHRSIGQPEQIDALYCRIASLLQCSQTLKGFLSEFREKNL